MPSNTRLPGDGSPRARLARFLRVDHAGEYGAKRIYQGQLAVLGRGPHGDTLRHMQAQEQVHLDHFVKLIGDRQVRPTALLPVWQVAGFALGAATALLGPKAARALRRSVPSPSRLRPGRSRTRRRTTARAIWPARSSS